MSSRLYQLLDYFMGGRSQALSYLGKDGIDTQTIIQCANRLSDNDVKTLSIASTAVPSWLADIILQIKQVKYGQIRTSL